METGENNTRRGGRDKRHLLVSQTVRQYLSSHVAEEGKIVPALAF
jgi:hypothetical protein